MTDMIPAIHGTYFPRLPLNRPVQRFSDHVAAETGVFEPAVADNAYAHPLLLPPGSSSLFAEFSEDELSHTIPADAYGILTQDFERLEAERAAHSLNDYA